MKKLASLFFVLSLVTAVAAQESNDQNENVWPWDFPQSVPLQAEMGQLALSCYGHYFDCVKEGKGMKDKVMIFYKTNVEKVGQDKTILADYGEETEVPNALIIPLDKNAKAKKGDIVLTWWQSGSGMQRAIVVDDSTPTEPVVCYLDLSWPDNPESPELEKKRKGEQLKPSTFSVLKGGKWQSGEQVAYRANGEWNAGKLIHTAGDKVLVSVFASYVEATTKDRVKLIPFKEKIKVGDKVSVVWLRYYRPGYVVTKVDDEAGHIYVKKEGSDRVECKSIAEVTKVLNN